MITVERAKEISLAVRLHFTSDSYNYFKYNGKTRSGELKLQDMWLRSIASNLETEDNVRDFFVANIMTDFKRTNSVPTYMGEFNSKKGYDAWKSWKANQNAFRVIVEDELTATKKTIKELIQLDNKVHPVLYSEYINGRVSIETICNVVAVIPKLLTYWDENTVDPVLLPEFCRVCKKYYLFTNIDKQNTKRIINTIQ